LVTEAVSEEELMMVVEDLRNIVKDLEDLGNDPELAEIAEEFADRLWRVTDTLRVMAGGTLDRRFTKGRRD